MITINKFHQRKLRDCKFYLFFDFLTSNVTPLSRGPVDNLSTCRILVDVE